MLHKFYGIPRNIQILKQVSRVIGKISQESANPDHVGLLVGAGAALNELMLLEQPGFYLRFIAEGHVLLDEGRALVGRSRAPAKPLDADLRPDALNTEIEHLYDALIDIIRVIDEGSGRQAKAFMDRVTDWEVGLYAHRMEQAPLPELPAAQAITQESVRIYLERRHPDWEDVRITRFMPLYGGFSKKTILFDTEDQCHGRQSLVIRAEQPGGITLWCVGSDKVANEFAVVQIMHEAGLPVADPVWLEENASALGHRFMVSRKMPGSQYGSAVEVTKPLSEDMLRHVLDILVKIHAVRPDPDDPRIRDSHLGRWLECKSMAENTRIFVQSIVDNISEKMGALQSPIVTRVARWLLANVPQDEGELVFIHSDYGLNNLLFEDERITAVLDWETTRIGDPADELAGTQKNIPAFKGRIRDMYEEATGVRISDYRLIYFEIVYGLKAIATCLCGLEMLVRYDAATVSLFTLGYRYIHRSFHDLNALIAKAEALKE